MILSAYQYLGHAKGSRSIHMRLLQMGIVMNRKKIQRLMNKYNLVCPIRKPNLYKRIAKSRKEHVTKLNHLNRQFKAYGPQTVLLTDITYLYYGRGQKALLSTFKVAFTNQILSHTLSESLEVDFVLRLIEQLMANHAIPKKQKTLIHSDQGIHYTSIQFQTLLNNKDYDNLCHVEGSFGIMHRKNLSLVI